MIMGQNPRESWGSLKRLYLAHGLHALILLFIWKRQQDRGWCCLRVRRTSALLERPQQARGRGRPPAPASRR